MADMKKVYDDLIIFNLYYAIKGCFGAFLSDIFSQNEVEIRKSVMLLSSSIAFLGHTLLKMHPHNAIRNSI